MPLKNAPILQCGVTRILIYSIERIRSQRKKLTLIFLRYINLFSADIQLKTILQIQKLLTVLYINQILLKYSHKISVSYIRKGIYTLYFVMSISLHRPYLKTNMFLKFLAASSKLQASKESRLESSFSYLVNVRFWRRFLNQYFEVVHVTNTFFQIICVIIFLLSVSLADIKQGLLQERGGCRRKRLCSKCFLF